MPNHHGVPLTTGTAFIGPAGSAVRNNDPEIGIPAENYSSRATSEASGTLRGNQTMDLTEAEADRYIDSLFDIDGFDGDNNNPANDVVGPYHPTMGGFGRGPSPHHHPEDDDYPPPPPEAHQYHDLERQRLDTPPQQAIYADTPGGSMDLPAHSGPSGSGSRNMYLPLRMITRLYLTLTIHLAPSHLRTSRSNTQRKISWMKWTSFSTASITKSTAA